MDPFRTENAQAVEAVFGASGAILEIWFLSPQGMRVSKVDPDEYKQMTSWTDPRTGATRSRLEGPILEGEMKGGWRMMDVCLTRIVRHIGGSA